MTCAERELRIKKTLHTLTVTPVSVYRCNTRDTEPIVPAGRWSLSLLLGQLAH